MFLKTLFGTATVTDLNSLQDTLEKLVTWRGCGFLNGEPSDLYNRTRLGHKH
jgi:hypothetical protein